MKDENIVTRKVRVDLTLELRQDNKGERWEPTLLQKQNRHLLGIPHEMDQVQWERRTRSASDHEKAFGFSQEGFTITQVAF